MNHKASPETKDRALALFALAATDAPLATSCPSEETLAQFIDGRLTGQARETMLTHLNRCRSCYHHWLEVASHLNIAAEASPTSTHAQSGVSVWQRLQIWFGDWKFAVPVAATAAVVLALVLWWPRSPDLNAELDLAYARLSAEHAAPAHALPSLPWESAALAFSESQASASRRAFGAGLWAGRRAWFGADEQTLPEVLSPPDGLTWLKTEWADYHTLGRWMMLVWALAASDQGRVDWHEQAAIGQRLLSELSKGATEQEEEAQRATAAVERLKPLLSALERAADPRSRAGLRRAVEIALQQLAP